MSAPGAGPPPGRPRRFVRAPEVLARIVGDSFVVLGAGAADPVVLEGSAAGVWSALVVDRTLEDLAVVLAERFDAGRVTIATDIAPVLEQFQLLGLVRSSE